MTEEKTEVKQPVDAVPTEPDAMAKADHWMTNVFPSWKNKIGVLLTAIAPFLYLTGQTFDIQAVQELLAAAPEVWAVITLVGSLIARIGYSFKK